MWHYHRSPAVFRGVKIEAAVSEDGQWTLLHDPFNLCCPERQPLYVDWYCGFPVAFRGSHSVRYVRLWSEGADTLPGNHYVEVSVYGRSPDAPSGDLFRPLSGGKVKLEPALPPPFHTASPSPPDNWPDTVESYTETWKRKDRVIVAEGCRLLSHRCKVTVSDPDPMGDPSQVTDGIRSSQSDDNLLNLALGRQWVLIDLGARREIHCVWLWLRDWAWVAHRNVIVQITDDPNQQGTIVLNNDHDGSEGFGRGTDPEWQDINTGRPVTFPPVTGRYVRVRTNGRTIDDVNVFAEVAVYGRDPAR
jgi:hypothetical protein